jgi:hypothetical protein
MPPEFSVILANTTVNVGNYSNPAQTWLTLNIPAETLNVDLNTTVNVLSCNITTYNDIVTNISIDAADVYVTLNNMTNTYTYNVVTRGGVAPPYLITAPYVTINITATSGGGPSGNILILPSPLPNAIIGIPYGVQLVAANGTPPYSGWSMVSGPAWLSVNSTGYASGTPTSVELDTVVWHVNDSS